MIWFFRHEVLPFYVIATSLNLWYFFALLADLLHKGEAIEMKKTQALFLAVIVLVGSFMVERAQAEHYGAIRSPLGAGEFSLGLGVAYNANEWQVANEALEVKQKEPFVQATFGLGSGWSVTGRGAVTTIVTNTESPVGGMYRLGDGKFTSGLTPMISGAIGGPVFAGKILSIGPFAHVSYIDFLSGSTRANALTTGGLRVSGTEKTSISQYAQATVGLSFQLELEGASLYFGPIYSLSRGDYKSSFSGRDELGGAQSAYVSSDVTQVRSTAGFAGIRWLLPENWPTSSSSTYLEVELRFKDDLSGGAALNFTF